MMPCEVGGDAVDPHGAEVDQADSRSPAKRKWSGPGVSQARLEGQVAAGRIDGAAPGAGCGQTRGLCSHRVAASRCGTSPRAGPRPIACSSCRSPLRADASRSRDDAQTRREPHLDAPRRAAGGKRPSAANADRGRAPGAADRDRPRPRRASREPVPRTGLVFLERLARSDPAIGAGIKPRSPAVSEPAMDPLQVRAVRTFGRPAAEHQGPLPQRYRQSRAPLSPPAPPRHSVSSSG